MKFEIFANNDFRVEIAMLVIQLFISATAALWLFLSDYQPFAPAVFFIVFLLQRINDQLVLGSGDRE